MRSGAWGLCPKDLSIPQEIAVPILQARTWCQTCQVQVLLLDSGQVVSLTLCAVLCSSVMHTHLRLIHIHHLRVQMTLSTAPATSLVISSLLLLPLIFLLQRTLKIQLEPSKFPPCVVGCLTKRVPCSPKQGVRMVQGRQGPPSPGHLGMRDSAAQDGSGRDLGASRHPAFSGAPFLVTNR